MLHQGSTIGILGGGQLGRMLALAAARLGLSCHVYAPEPDSPAFAVVRRHTCAGYGDHAALARFAEDCDVITYEFENVPAETAAFLAARKPVRPDPAVLETTQDRLIEKNFVARLGIATPRYESVTDVTTLADALAKLGRPAVLKTRRFGYDGKGQAIIRAGDDAERAWHSIGEQPAILEEFVPFEREVSIIAAHGLDGDTQCFDVTENEHRDHILKVSRAPAAISPDLDRAARAIAAQIAEAFGYVGVFAVELFVVGGPQGERLLVNEIAPRVHNSGHWTLDGCAVSQFEQHIRAIAGWPLAPPARHGVVTMTNLIGNEIDELGRWLKVPGATVHHYGKSEARPGRKMGHVTVVQTVGEAPATRDPDRRD